jgi:hypothetical protein
MPKVYDIQKLSFEDDRMRLQVDGREYAFDLTYVSRRLLHASAEERMKYEVSPCGYGIHWPLVDEDLSADALLGVKHRPPESKLRSQRGVSGA